MVTLPSTLFHSLAAIVGEPHVLTGDATAGFAVDWTGRFRGHTPTVVRPGDTAEVAAVLALCTDAGVPVVPQGGNTGLVGGGVPLHGEVVLSRTRLDRLGPVDHEASQVTAGAGVTLQRTPTRAGIWGTARAHQGRACFRDHAPDGRPLPGGGRSLGRGGRPDHRQAHPTPVARCVRRHRAARAIACPQWCTRRELRVRGAADSRTGPRRSTAP